MLKILIVGQTPPPFHGQAVATESIVNGKYQNVETFHVRMAFSKENKDVGQFQVGKLIHLIEIISKIIWMRFRRGIHVLYYPPTGHQKIPVYRDLAILISTRWLFKKTIFHFHPGGSVLAMYQSLSPFIKPLFRWAYFEPDGTIRLSEFTPEDDDFLKSKKKFIIPNGIEDHYEMYHNQRPKQNMAVTILFVASLRESKGVLVLLDACRILRDRNLDLQLNIMGKFATEVFKKTTLERVHAYGLESQVTFLGLLTGDEKWESFAQADIFCFPSYDTEAMPLVVIEAMQFALPVVSTRQGGIPNLVDDRKTGFLVSIKNSLAVADKLEHLIKNLESIQEMGYQGRRKYLKHYTLDHLLHNLEKAFLDI